MNKYLVRGYYTISFEKEVEAETYEEAEEKYFGEYSYDNSQKKGA